MKRILFIPALLFSVCASAQIEKVIPKKPSPAMLVNDFTNTLTAQQVEALENKLVASDNSTSNQIVVVIINSTKGYSIDEVGLGVLRNWGVGNQEKNNGVVLLVAKDDRKVGIQTGYGLEGAIPDLTAKSIIDNEILSNFKAGNYYRGLDEGTDAIIKAAAGVYKAPSGYRSKKKGIGFGTIIFILMAIFFILVGFGGRGGSGGMMSPAGWLIGGMLGSSGRGGGWSGGGGGWSGGGGGFGGFGGGSGGGGGASGGW